MRTYSDLDEANKRIEELETELAKVREQLAFYENRQYSGRKKHDSKWQASYDVFVELYENGKSIAEIVCETDFSQRTAYRYKTYYDSIVNSKNKEQA